MRTVIGVHACREVLKVRPKDIQEIWIKEKSEKDPDISYFVDFAKKNRIRLHAKPEGAFSRIAQSHQGVAVYVKSAPDFSLDDISAENETHLPEKMLLVALDEITDPHNLGAILRTSWLMGVRAVLTPEHRSVGLTPAVAKVASGGAEHVSVLTVDNLPRTLSYLKDKGFWIYGLASDAKYNMYEMKFPNRVVLVVGAEDKGLRSTVKGVCDELISIPQADSTASYNASVATAIVMSEVYRQQGIGS